MAPSHRRSSACRHALALLWCAPLSAQWQAPTAAQLVPPTRGDSPLLACSREGLERLRQAFRGGESIVTSRIDTARANLGKPVSFPPRGGQHNQWYQCDACQLALVTIDATHHRCPQCHKVYTGPPYDDVIFAHQHGENLQRAHDAAWAFAITGERAFADDARTVLLGYGDRYETYPYHCNAKDPSKAGDSGGHLNAQTLTEASLFTGRIAPAIDLVWPALNADERERLLQHLVLPIVQNIGKCRRGKGNWQSWHNAAMFAGGMLLGDADWLRRATIDPKNGFCFQMQHSISAEGMWYENSFGYHLYALDALASQAEFAQRAGIDLFGNPALRAMCTLPSRYLMGDGKLPRMGDDVDSKPSRAQRAIEAAYAATHDPTLLAVLPNHPTWESLSNGREVGAGATEPVLGSEVFRTAGHAILRDAGPAKATALITFAPFGGFHGHFDKLSFVWHAFGSERGVDPGRAASQAYRLPIHNGWYRSTLGHNAVVVDGHSQKGADGELLAFVTGKGFSAVAALTKAAYPGVDQRRCLVLTEDYLVVFDQLDSSSEHTWDWVYHDTGAEARCAEATAPAEPLGIDGEQFVHWQHQGQTEAAIAVRFPGTKVSTRLWMAAGGATGVHTGTGPFRSAVEQTSFVLLRRTGTQARFAAVLAAERNDHPSPVDGVTPLPGLVSGLRIQRGGVADEVTWDGADKVVFRRGE